MNTADGVAGSDAEKARKEIAAAYPPPPVPYARTGAELAEAQRAELEASHLTVGEIKYTHDGDFRVAHVQCVKCGAKCDIHQTENRDTKAWSPDAATQFALFGWQNDGRIWFCGKWCAQMYTQQMRDHGGKPLPVVTRITDQTYARRLYAAQAQDQTTPAVPPQTGARK